MNILNFFVEVKEELGKVVWPTRKETIMYTGIVIVFSVIVSIVLGAADFGLISLFEKLLNK